MKMTIVEKQITRSGSIRVRAWDNGKLVDVYAYGKKLHGSRAKRFPENDDQKIVTGRVYLDQENRLYFVPRTKPSDRYLDLD